MFVEEHRDQPAAEDDFEWVNAWAAASAREGTNPRVAAASENAPEAPVPAVTVIDAPALAEPVLAADNAVAAQEPIADTAPSSDAVAQLPASSLDAVVPEPSARFEDEGVGEVDSAAPPNATGVASIPQSTEVTPLPEVPVQVRPFRRAPWTTLFRLVSGDTGRLPRDLATEHPVATHETVELDAPTPVAIPSELVDQMQETVLADAPTSDAIPVERVHQTHETVLVDAPTSDAIPAELVDQAHETELVDAPTPDAVPSELADRRCDTDVLLAPDQLDRDIAEIELVRDQLLAELQPVASVAGAEPNLLRRTSDMVPILVGGALGFILLVVFGAAASFVSLR